MKGLVARAGKGTGRLCDPHAKATAGPVRWLSVQPWVRLGKGRGDPYPNDKERNVLCLMRGEALS